MGSAPTTTVQGTLLPPTAVYSTLKLRLDLGKRTAHLSVTVDDAKSGEMIAASVHPFMRDCDLEGALTEASRLLRSLLLEVLDPTPF